MADKSIHELPVASLLTDAGLLVVYQDGKTQSIRGELIKQYAAQGVSQYVEEAKTAAQTAGDAAGEAQAAAEEAKGVALYPPQVNPETGVWQTWDAAQQQYVDTDQKAEGPEGPAGSSIQSIQRTSGTGAPGTTDTYTVTLTNGSTTTFQVYNGADGAGTGDFKADGSVPMTGALQMARHTISGLPAPVADSDPVRKQDVPTLAADRQLSNLDTLQAALANLGAGVRPNLLDNAYFIGGGTGNGVLPVNQRGKISYTDESGISVPSIDRWLVANATLTLDSDGVQINSTAYNNNFLQIVKSWDRLVGEVVTVSILVSDISGGNAILGVNNAPALEITSPGIYQKTFVVASGVNRAISLAMQPGVSIKVQAMKLEVGDTQTLAYKKSAGDLVLLQQPENTYATQLLECQRYQLALWRYFISPAVHFQPNYIDFSIPIPIEMRTTPILTQEDFAIYSDEKGGQSDFALSIVGMSSNAIRVRATKEGHGLTLSDGIRIEVGVERAILNAGL